MTYEVNIIINDKENKGTLQITETSFILEVDKQYKGINIKDIFAIDEIDDKTMNVITTSKQLITITSNNIEDIVINLNSFNNYYKNIRINKKARCINGTLRSLTIFTIGFMILYNGFIGLEHAKKWGVSYISAFIGNILGDNGDEPLDTLQIILYIAIFIEIILIIIKKNNLKKECINILEKNRKKVPIKEENDLSKYDELERLKELLDKGIITEEDFNKKKQEILK